MSPNATNIHNMWLQLKAYSNMFPNQMIRQRKKIVIKIIGNTYYDTIKTKKKIYNNK